MAMVVVMALHLMPITTVMTLMAAGPVGSSR
jgi:hypothetical protein